jgi:hypothetical protein
MNGTLTGAGVSIPSARMSPSFARWIAALAIIVNVAPDVRPPTRTMYCAVEPAFITRMPSRRLICERNPLVGRPVEGLVPATVAMTAGTDVFGDWWKRAPGIG